MNTTTANRQDFKATGCIDWLGVTIKTVRETQARYIKAHLDKITGGKYFIDPSDKQKNTGENATVFIIRFYDEPANDSLALIAIVDKLRERFPFRDEPTVSTIEVACDFRYKGPASELNHETLAMTFRLQSSLFAPAATKPRQFDPRISSNRFLGGFNDEGARIDPRLNFRIGNKFDDVSWQSYFKTTDNNQRPIEPSHWRARVEVTIQGATLCALGINGLTDLRGYDFQKLMPFFRFRRPIDPERQAKGDLFVLTAIRANRRIHDATGQRGLHSFNAIGQRDKRLRHRVESSHLEADETIQDAVKGAMKRLTV